MSNDDSTPVTHDLLKQVLRQALKEQREQINEDFTKALLQLPTKSSCTISLVSSEIAQSSMQTNL